MYILLPILCFCSLFIILSKDETNWRVSYLQTALLLILYVVVITELLSTLQALTDAYVCLSWSLLTIALLALLHQKRRVGIPLNLSFSRKQLSTYLLLIGLIWIVPLLFLAVYCAPNNQDGLSYHLVRIQHWIQNKNVYYYPTNFTVQNYYNVLSEYCLLHSQLLSGSDYFMNAVQCMAMLSSLVAASLIAQQFGASSKTQLVAFLLVLTLPMGILQSTTTQNDYLTGFFSLTAIYWGLRLIQGNASRKMTIGYLALSIALGGFTKYSFFLIALPFVIWFGFAYIAKYNWQEGIKLALVCLLVLLTIYGPFWYRNYQMLGSILSPAPDSPLFLDSYSNEHVNTQVILSNLSKNVAMHLALPSQPYNDALLAVINRFHQLLGIAVNDPTTTLGDYKLSFTINEDTSTNCFHLLLTIAAVAIIFFRSTDRTVRLYGICLVGSLLVYSAGFKWQYFHSRTQLPIFLLAAPFVAQAIESLQLKKAYWINALVVVLLIASLPYVYGNNGKTIIPVRSLTKQIIGYSPSSVNRSHFPTSYSPQQLTQMLAMIGYRPSKVANGWYDCNLREHPAYERLKEIGYAPPQEATIWNINDRQDFFFITSTAKKNEWDRICTILKKGNHHSVGVMIEGPELIYPLWSSMRQTFNQIMRVEYIYFPAVLNQLANSQLKSPYSCIISNLGYSNDIIPEGAVRQIHKVGSYQVIELREPSTFVYNSRPEFNVLEDTSILVQKKTLKTD